MKYIGSAIRKTPEATIRTATDIFKDRPLPATTTRPAQKAFSARPQKPRPVSD